MEYLLYLVKHHASEVDQALQYDPTLKAEIDFDLRQFERQRKEQAQQQLQQQQQQARGPMSAIKRTSNMPTPHLDRIVASMSVSNSAIRPSTVQKPVLKSASKLSVTSSTFFSVPFCSAPSPSVRVLITCCAVDDCRRT